MKRRLAREIAVQSLFQMEMNGVSAQEAIDTIVEEAGRENETDLTLTEGETISTEYIHQLVEGTVTHMRAIDEVLTEYLKGWKMDRLSRVDRQILRLAAYEMLHGQEVPPKVVINEAIELSKHFGTEESGKFVNGVLGKMIKELPQLQGR
ncbi:transcription antitermination factor NusB [Paenibacillus sp. HJGM_3]|uniref:transcription antitermination factor NusB n=1 Tax=Paenibacillus sp. HJGM_3 TaxID=3379816 RepID=UPI0038585158